MLAEPIIVPDGDSFLQLPVTLADDALPTLPALTYRQMRRLRDQLAGLAGGDGPWAQPFVLIDDGALPELPKLDWAQVTRLAGLVDRALRDPAI